MTAEPISAQAAPAGKRLLVPLLIAAFLALQLAVPTIALFGPRPARFAWQMYSALPDVPKAFAVEADGSERPINLQQLFAVQRAEIDYPSVMREGLCDATGAPAIRLDFAEGRDQVIPCH